MSCKKAKGKRSKSRAKMTAWGSKTTVNTLLSKFEKGSLVTVDIRPALHSGLPDLIYQGVVGTVSGQRGKLCWIDVNKGNSPKRLLVHPGHLRHRDGVAK